MLLTILGRFYLIVLVLRFFTICTLFGSLLLSGRLVWATCFVVVCLRFVVYGCWCLLLLWLIIQLVAICLLGFAFGFGCIVWVPLLLWTYCDTERLLVVGICGSG